MNMIKKKPTVGILFDKRGDPPYISVGKLWTETINLISEKFQTEIYKIDDYLVENSSEYQEFVSKIDLLMMLSPYYSIDRTKKRFPVVAYGLGSLQKGGHWLFDNRNSFRSYDSIVLNCTSCQNIFDLLMGKDGMNTYLIPFGVDTNVFYPRHNKMELRKKYNIPEDVFVMVYSGRISLQKNSHLLVSLLKDLEKEYKNIYLMMIGFFDNFYIPEFSDQPAPNSKVEFYKLIDELDIKSKVRIFNNQSDPNIYAEMLSVADIGINLTTLISENFGYTPVEMQASGLPVIGTDWGGLKDTIIDGETGYHITTVLSEYGVRINLKLAISRIKNLIGNKELLRKMGIEARKNVEKKYSHISFAVNMQDIIEDTYQKFINSDFKEQFFKHNPIVERLSNTLHKQYGKTRHVSWEHLHPLKDFEHYKLVVSKCVTEDYKNVIWDKNSHISKGFDWKINGNEFVSYDPRWNTSFELVNWRLTDKEVLLLKLIDFYDYTVRDLLEKENMIWEELFELLSRLTRKGLIIPFYYEEAIKHS